MMRLCRPRAGCVFLCVAAVALLFAAMFVDGALAQGSPFGVGRAPTAPPPPAADGIVGWLLAKQAEFYRSLSGLIRAAKADGSAVWALLGVSFLYGVFHAAGPGHGKAVISSYLVANDETWRRGVVLSFASALLQAFVAVAVVGVAAVLLNATAKTMGDAVRWIEIVSYGLIAAVGARCCGRKDGPSLSALHAVTAQRPLLAAAGGGGVVVPVHDHHDHHHDHRHDHLITITTTITAITITITRTTTCTMRRAVIARPEPKTCRTGRLAARPDGDRGGRLRPCSGAILVRCSRWPRACSGPESRPRSSWGSAPPSRWR